MNNENFGKRASDLHDSRFTFLQSPKPYARPDMHERHHSPTGSINNNCTPSSRDFATRRDNSFSSLNDVIEPASERNFGMSHQQQPNQRHHQQQHNFAEQQQQRRPPPFQDDYYYPARFGSMDRLRGSSGGLRDAHADVFQTPLSFRANTIGKNFPSSQHRRNTFFDDMDDDFERKFFERAEKMSTPPSMPEWGFAAGPVGGGADGGRQSPFASMDGGGGGRQSPFSRGPPFMGSMDRQFVKRNGQQPQSFSGSSERIIPIRVEGKRGETKPAPPYKPPELTKTYQSREQSSRQIPIQRDFSPATASSSRQAPDEGRFSAGQPQGGAASKATQEPILRHETVDGLQHNRQAAAAPAGKFEPDQMIQKLTDAPKLSHRLAGKTNTFDQLSDVLSQLPRPPNRPSVDRELDEKLAPVISALAISKPTQSTSEPPVSHVSPPSASTIKLTETSNMDGRQGPILKDEPSAEAPRTVQLFDDAIKESLDEFASNGQKIGSEVGEITNLAKEAIGALRAFLWNAAITQKPADNASLVALLKPVSDKIESIQAYTSSRRPSQFFNHLSTISEGIPALGWVTVSPTPAPFIKEMADASQFYVNRVLKDYKEKDKVHVDWTKSWTKLLTEMQSYVKQNHTTGLVWNSSPSTKAPQGAPAAPVAKGPPGAPPPPPPSYLQDMKQDGKSTSSEADSRAALFADINKGLDITKGLKKVTDDLKTHKNPALREASSPVPSKLDSTSAGGAKRPTTPTNIQRPPKIELEAGKKWVVEYVNNDQNVVIDVQNMKQVAYVYKCSNAVIHFKGKLNSIVIDNCTKTGIVFEDLVSSLEIINSQGIKVQATGKMPTLAVQKTDGCQIFLGPESLNTEIVTSKSSEMNVLIPNSNGEFDEFPLPEQYKTVWDGKKLQTTVVDIA